MNWSPYIKGFEAYLLMEKSLSKNSIEAYLRDVGKLYEYLQIKGFSLQPEQIRMSHVEAFLAYLFDLGLNEKSCARMLSGVKAFYKYLMMEDLVADDPTELIMGLS
ncbi:MAG: site-specific integrase [Saprospiraceae bacterium]|nr:site-specific integrase [Saprospiraceae bacterium]